MSSFDVFCGQLLEQAKRFNEKAKVERDTEGISAYKNASLVLSICALEAYINGISEEITLAKGFPIHEKGILLEKEVRLEKGQWSLSNTLKISRLTDKIELLYWRHVKKKLDTTEKWWEALKIGIDIRNKITHPKEEVVIPEELNGKIIEAVIDCISVLYKAIYRRNFPKFKTQVSTLNF
jgi:hypothetical protein